MKRRLALILPVLFAALALNCVQPTRAINITFEVDMRLEIDVESAGVIGEYFPLSWNEPIALSDADGDSIFTGEATLNIPYDDFEFKFVKNGNVIELDGGNNRELNVKEKNRYTYSAVFDTPQ